MEAGERDPWEYIASFRYEDAIRAYQSRSSQDDWPNLSIALLCVGRLSEALSGFERARQLRNVEHARHGLTHPQLPFNDFIGGIHWMLGHRQSATDAFKAAADGLLKGTIEYTDASGGVSQGLLLWYCSKAEGVADEIEYSTRYLANRAQKKRASNWPGPIAMYLLGQMSEKALLVNEFYSDNHSEIETSVASDLLKRRHYINALFYIACKMSHEGDGAKSRELMQRCALLENPHVEIEWYLARQEVGLDFIWRRMGHLN